jgi:hypothetical protein
MRLFKAPDRAPEMPRKLINQERQHFSRKLKWDPSDFSNEKFAGGYCLRRPAFVLLRPCRMALHFDYASAVAPTSSKRPAPTATWGSSYTAPLALRFLYSFNEGWFFWQKRRAICRCLKAGNGRLYRCIYCLQVKYHETID